MDISLRQIPILLSAAVFLLLPPLNGFSNAGDEAGPKGRWISPDAQFDFAARYVEQGDYARAATEYERFVFFFPDDPRVPGAKYSAAEAYTELREYSRAANIFRNLIKDHNTSPKALDAHFGISRCCLALGDLNCAVQRLRQVTRLTDETRIKDRAWYDMGWVYAAYARWESAAAAGSRISPENSTAWDVSALSDRLAAAEDIPRKSPKTAALLSIVPGGGYFYCNRYKDALTAFVLNGGLMLAAFSAFKNDNPALGGVITFVEAGFYGGNIYGGMNAAHKFNKRQTDNFIQDLKKDYRVRLSMDFNKNKFGVSYEKTF